MERQGVITMQGKPLTLLGPALKPGDKAPDFNLLDAELAEYTLKDFSGKIKIISVTPSLDTPVCDVQARKFNEAADKFPDNAAVMNVSMDLPFAIGRFCAVTGIKRLKVFSDHRNASFGDNYGVLIKELRLLARALFIIDASDVIRYVQIVPEISTPPDYDTAFDFLEKVMGLQHT